MPPAGTLRPGSVPWRSGWGGLSAFDVTLAEIGTPADLGRRPGGNTSKAWD